MSNHVPTAEFVVHPEFLGRNNMTAEADNQLNLNNSVMVRGTSFRQFELKALSKSLPEASGAHQIFHAQLVLDPNNPTDKQAIAVFAGAAHIGYVAKTYLGGVQESWDDEAKAWKQCSRYQLLTERIAALRGSAAICRAVILNTQGKGKNFLGVRIYIDSKLVKGNPKPAKFKTPGVVTAKHQKGGVVTTSLGEYSEDLNFVDLSVAPVSFGSKTDSITFSTNTFSSGETFTFKVKDIVME